MIAAPGQNIKSTLYYMEQGWELVSQRFGTTKYIWLQKRGKGKGGHTYTVRKDIFETLLSSGYIGEDGSDKEITKYKLKEA